MPGILALPGALIAPKASIIGTAAASLLGCGTYLESENGKSVYVGKEIKKAADTVVDTAKNAAKTVKAEVEKAWNDLSADDPEGRPVGEENEDEEAEAGADTASAEEVVEVLEKHETDDTPVIHVENPNKPE